MTYQRHEKDESPALRRLVEQMNRLHSNMGGRDARPERLALKKCMQILDEEIKRSCTAWVKSGEPVFESWGSPEGRCGIQRTLVDDAADQQFLDEGIRMVDEHGREHKLTTEEANAMGVRRVVAAKDIRTGEMKFRDDARTSTPFFVVRAVR